MRRPTLTRPRGWWLVVAVAAVVALFVGFGLVEREASEGATASESEPAAVEPVDGTGLSRVTLTSSAAERLGLETRPVRRQAGRKVVPYSALLYDAGGRTWVYTRREELTFIRAPIQVGSVRGDVVFLESGPEVGTEVVSVAAAELYGTEFEVDH